MIALLEKIAWNTIAAFVIIAAVGTCALCVYGFIDFFIKNPTDLDV